MSSGMDMMEIKQVQRHIYPSTLTVLVGFLVGLVVGVMGANVGETDGYAGESVGDDVVAAATRKESVLLCTVEM